MQSGIPIQVQGSTQHYLANSTNSIPPEIQAHQLAAAYRQLSMPSNHAGQASSYLHTQARAVAEQHADYYKKQAKQPEASQIAQKSRLQLLKHNALAFLKDFKEAAKGKLGHVLDLLKSLAEAAQEKAHQVSNRARKQ
ncbi:MAG: hypothetical protein VKJ06_09180 [Vampirovibrionales bacterium]|nr:hypothetical protein [Vampirovibrionales bacterium]